jgi:hypothetical protein
VGRPPGGSQWWSRGFPQEVPPGGFPRWMTPGGLPPRGVHHGVYSGISTGRFPPGGSHGGPTGSPPGGLPLWVSQGGSPAWFPQGLPRSGPESVFHTGWSPRIVPQEWSRRGAPGCGVPEVGSPRRSPWVIAQGLTRYVPNGVSPMGVFQGLSHRRPPGGSTWRSPERVPNDCLQRWFQWKFPGVIPTCRPTGVAPRSVHPCVVPQGLSPRGSHRDCRLGDVLQVSSARSSTKGWSTSGVHQLGSPKEVNICCPRGLSPVRCPRWVPTAVPLWVPQCGFPSVDPKGPPRVSARKGSPGVFQSCLPSGFLPTGGSPREFPRRDPNGVS